MMMAEKFREKYYTTHTLAKQDETNSSPSSFRWQNIHFVLTRYNKTSIRDIVSWQRKIRETGSVVIYSHSTCMYYYYLPFLPPSPFCTLATCVHAPGRSEKGWKVSDKKKCRLYSVKYNIENVMGMSSSPTSHHPPFDKIHLVAHSPSRRAASQQQLDDEEEKGLAAKIYNLHNAEYFMCVVHRIRNNKIRTAAPTILLLVEWIINWGECGGVSVGGNISHLLCRI